MKKLVSILAVTFVFSAAAFGAKPSASDSWKKLTQDRQMERVMFLFPQYALSYGQFAWGPSVCLDGDTIKLKTTIEKCVKRGRGDERHECLEYKTVRPEVAVSGTRYRCVERNRDEGGCARYDYVPYTYNTEMMIPVHSHTQSDNGGWTSRSNFGRKLFEKYFAVDQCS